MRLIGRCFWHCCRLPFLGSVMIRDWVHGTGHFPICQILLQIVVTPVSTSSPPAWTGSTGMLSTPADFPFFNDCIAAFIFYFFYFFCEGWGGRPLCMSGNSSVLIDPRWPCACTAQSSILSISSAFFVRLWGIFLSDLGQLKLSLVSQWSSFLRVYMPSYCCSSSDFLQSHNTVLLSSFVCLFHAPLDVVHFHVIFSAPSDSNLFFLSFLLL